MKRKLRKREFFVIAILAFIVLGLATHICVRIYHHYYGMQLISSGEYAPVNEAGEYNIAYKGEYTYKAIQVDEKLYLDMEMINEDWAEGMLFYAEDIQKVLYTTPTEMIESEINRDDFKSWNGRIYMRADLAKEMFGTQFAVNEEASIVAVQVPEGLMAEVMESDAYLLAQPDRNERSYTAKLKIGDTIAIFEKEDMESDDFYFAMAPNGCMGYIPKEKVQPEENRLSRKTPQELKMAYGKLPSGPVSLAWQQVYSNEFTPEVYTEIQNASYYINVVSPTWFKLNEQGGIDSLANEDYVVWAHNQGLQVWALFDNSFDDELTYRTLSSTAKRRALADQLLAYCEEYNLNGINVDFEDMSEETDRYFVQFLRELAIKLRSNDYLLTVDCAVPSAWTDYYERDVMATVCDYVIVMAYDEHYGGGEEAGSTASQRFTMEAVYDMINEGVAKEKLILGVPFYTRIWKGIDNLRSEAVGMDTAQRCIEENDLKVVFDKTTGQNYAEGMVEGTLYRIWLEDTTSMKWRMRLMMDNQLAGVAAWSLGFENDDIWTVYEEVLYP